MKNFFIVLIILVGGYYVYQHRSVEGPPEPYDAILFTDRTNSICNKASNLLDDNDILYLEYDVNESKDNMKLFRKYRGKILPLLIIGSERIDGYNDTLIKVAINSLFENESESEIIMFTMEGCGYCTKTRELLSKYNVDFVEYDIIKYPENRKKYDKLGGRGVPLTIIGNNKITGYNEKALKMAIKQID
jgi:glutaredoxin